MIAAVTREGLGRALRVPRLAVVVWLVNLALAMAAGVPGWLALHSALGPLPATDAIGEGLSFSVVADLGEMRPGLLGGLGLSALGAAFLGLVLGAAVTGGLLEVLMSRDERPFAHRFGYGAGRFFGRFARAGLVAVVLGGLAALLAALPFALLGRAARGSAWEPARLAAALATGLAAFLVFLLALLALDAARILIVRDDLRRVAPALRSGFRVVLGRPIRWLGAWAVNALLVGLAAAAYLALSGALVPPSGPFLLALVLLQQAFALTRAGLRVALLGSEAGLVERLLPRPAEPPREVPPGTAEAMGAILSGPDASAERTGSGSGPQ
jgi:hypothetical protein